MAGEGNLRRSSIVADLASRDGHVLESIVPCAPLRQQGEDTGSAVIKLAIEGAERWAIEGLVNLLPELTERLLQLSPELIPKWNG